MKKRTFASLAMLLSACLLLAGCIFGGQNETIPTQPQQTTEKTAEAETSGAGFPGTVEVSSESTVIPSSSETAEPESPQVSSEAAEPESPQTSSEAAGISDTTAAPSPGPSSNESSAPNDPAGPAAAETNDQIMTASAARETDAYRILSGLNWADTVWTDHDDLCHLRITDLTDGGLSFYWHTRSLNYPNSFQSELCTAAFDGGIISCDYTDDRGNTGTVKLQFTEGSIYFLQSVTYSENAFPSDLVFMLQPRTSGVPAMYFNGSWKDALTVRKNMIQRSSYYGKVSTYIEQVLGITDISGCCEELLDTDTRLYTMSELTGFDKDLVKIFKNEIYARHGYRFSSEELYAMFMEFTWYYPDFSPENFDESVLNQFEQANLRLLTKLEGS